MNARVQRRTCLRRRLSGRAQLNRPQVAQNHWRLVGAQAGLAREPEHDEAFGTWQWLRHQQQTQPGRGRAAAQQSRGRQRKSRARGAARQSMKQNGQRQEDKAKPEQTVAAAWQVGVAAGKEGTGQEGAARGDSSGGGRSSSTEQQRDNDRQGQASSCCGWQGADIQGGREATEHCNDWHGGKRAAFGKRRQRGLREGRAAMGGKGLVRTGWSGSN